MSEEQFTELSQYQSHGYNNACRCSILSPCATPFAVPLLCGFCEQQGASTTLRASIAERINSKGVACQGRSGYGYSVVSQFGGTVKVSQKSQCIRERNRECCGVRHPCATMARALCKRVDGQFFLFAACLGPSLEPFAQQSSRRQMDWLVADSLRLPTSRWLTPAAAVDSFGHGRSTQGMR